MAEAHNAAFESLTALHRHLHELGYKTERRLSHLQTPKGKSCRSRSPAGETAPGRWHRQCRRGFRVSAPLLQPLWPPGKRKQVQARGRGRVRHPARVEETKKGQGSKAARPRANQPGPAYERERQRGPGRKSRGAGGGEPPTFRLFQRVHGGCGGDRAVAPSSATRARPHSNPDRPPPAAPSQHQQRRASLGALSHHTPHPQQTPPSLASAGWAGPAGRIRGVALRWEEGLSGLRDKQPRRLRGREPRAGGTEEHGRFAGHSGDSAVPAHGA